MFGLKLSGWIMALFNYTFYLKPSRKIRINNKLWWRENCYLGIWNDWFSFMPPMNNISGIFCGLRDIASMRIPKGVTICILALNQRFRDSKNVRTIHFVEYRVYWCGPTEYIVLWATDLKFWQHSTLIELNTIVAFRWNEMKGKINFPRICKLHLRWSHW